MREEVLGIVGIKETSINVKGLEIFSMVVLELDFNLA